IRVHPDTCLCDCCFFFFSSRRRHTRSKRDWSSDVCSSDLGELEETVIPDFEIEALARCLLPKIQAYFESPEGKAAFEKWKQQHRSEERRVGKECRCGWSTESQKKKQRE